MGIDNSIYMQRNLAQEQRLGLLERFLGKVLGVPQEEQQVYGEHSPHIDKSSPLPQERGLFTGFGDFLAELYEKAQEKASEISSSAGHLFGNAAPQQLELVHIGGGKDALQVNPEFVQHQAAQAQVRDSLSAVLGGLRPGDTPASPKASAEAYHGPQLGLGLRAQPL